MVLMFVMRAQPTRAEHGHDGDGNKQRHRQGEHHDERKLREQDARDALQEEQRDEHGDVRERRRQDCRPDFLAAVDGGRHPVLAFVEVAMGVFEHDDRRVDDHAYAERQSSEGHRVQCEAAEVEQRKGTDDRHGNRRADDQRRPKVAQEGDTDPHKLHIPKTWNQEFCRCFLQMYACIVHRHREYSVHIAYALFLRGRNSNIHCNVLLNT